jgi:DNA-binding transcriptional MerR regulator
MPHNEEDSISDSPFGEGAEDTEAWATIKELTAGLNVSASTVKRMVKNGEIGKPRRNDAGEYVYPVPEGFDRAKAQQRSDEVSAAFLLAEAGKIMQNQGKQIQQLVDTVSGPVVQMMGILHQHVAATSEDNMKLRAKVFEGIALQEQMLSQEHERILEQAKFEAQQRRLDQAFDIGKLALNTYLKTPNVNVRKLQAAETVLKALPLADLKVMLSAEGDESILPTPEAREAAKILVEELEREAALTGSGASPAVG